MSYEHTQCEIILNTKVREVPLVPNPKFRKGTFLKARIPILISNQNHSKQLVGFQNIENEYADL